MDAQSVGAWLARCLAPQTISLESARGVGKGSGCRVWECEVDGESLILKLYSPGFDDYSRLGPVDTARTESRPLGSSRGCTVSRYATSNTTWLTSSPAPRPTAAAVAKRRTNRHCGRSRCSTAITSPSIWRQPQRACACSTGTSSPSAIRCGTWVSCSRLTRVWMRKRQPLSSPHIKSPARLMTSASPGTAAAGRRSGSFGSL